MDDVDTDQLTRFADALNQLRTSTPDPNGEPQLRSLADPPGKALLHAYLDSLPPHEQSAVFAASVPSHNERPSGQAWLLKTLLKQWGDADWDKREAASTKEANLKHLLKLKTQLVVVTDIHQPFGKPATVRDPAVCLPNRHHDAEARSSANPPGCGNSLPRTRATSGAFLPSGGSERPSHGRRAPLTASIK